MRCGGCVAASRYPAVMDTGWWCLLAAGWILLPLVGGGPPSRGRASSALLSCYQRTGVGKRLNETEVASVVPLRTLRHCEQECERALCPAFSFGLSPSGNGSCQIANMMPTAEPISDLDYDLFYKDPKCINQTSCFKRLAVGRSLNYKFVKRSLLCDSLRACEETCSAETAFYCEGFNFKYDRMGEESRCQLTDVPSAKLDITSDFNPDVDFDFYERDRNAPRRCLFPPGQSPYPGGGGSSYPGSNGLAPPPYHGNGYGQGGGAYGLVGSGWGLPDECFLRTRVGFRLHRNVILVSLNVPALYDCENLCVNEKKFRCNVFSFRYSPAVPGHNCHLGERAYQNLDDYNDIVPDRDFDIYERNLGGSQNCQPKKYWGSECFERVRSGLKLKDATIKYALKVNSLSECESACINIPFFTCRAFSYRYGPPVIGESTENCLLTDWSIPDLNSQKDLTMDPECELYNRGSYGHGCEINRFPYRSQLGPTPPPRPPPPPALGGPYGRPLAPPPLDGYGPGNEIHNTYLPPDKPSQGMIPPPRPGVNSGYLPPDNHGYLPPLEEDQGGGYRPHKYYPPYKPDIYPPKQDPGYLPPRKPDFGGYLPPPKPDQGGYPRPPQDDYGFPPPRRPPFPPNKHDGYLPPPRKEGYLPPYKQGGYQNDFFRPDNGGYRPGETYLPPSSYGVQNGYRPRPSQHLCYVQYSTPARLLPPAIKTSLWVRTEDGCKDECSRAREKTKFRCATISYRDGVCELSDIEQRDLRPGYDYLQDKEFWMFTWDFGSPTCYLPPPPGRPPLLNDPSYDQGNRVGPEDTWARFTVNGQPCRAGTSCSQNKEVGVWTCPVDTGDWDYCCRSGHQCGYSDGFSYPWCYVGSADKDQWRPCSDTYRPYAHDARRAHWPVAYLHREGPPNVTLTHRPSVVDSFIKSLEKSGFLTTTTAEGGSSTGGLSEGPEPRNTERSGGDAMDKLLTWAKTGLSSMAASSVTAPMTSTTRNNSSSQQTEVTQTTQPASSTTSSVTASTAAAATNSTNSTTAS